MRPTTTLADTNIARIAANCKRENRRNYDISMHVYSYRGTDTVNLWQSIKKAFSQPDSKPASAPATAPATAPASELDEVALPAELAPAQVQAALAGSQPPLLLDVRERTEWEQVRISAALHIPMNDVPDRLGELPRNQPIVVFCAHGSRSFGVAHYLCEQGFAASNLAGGITQWRILGGAVETGKV